LSDGVAGVYGGDGGLEDVAVLEERGEDTATNNDDNRNNPTPIPSLMMDAVAADYDLVDVADNVEKEKQERQKAEEEEKALIDMVVKPTDENKYDDDHISTISTRSSVANFRKNQRVRTVIGLYSDVFDPDDPGEVERRLLER